MCLRLLDIFKEGKLEFTSPADDERINFFYQNIDIKHTKLRDDTWQVNYDLNAGHYFEEQMARFLLEQHAFKLYEGESLTKTLEHEVTEDGKLKFTPQEHHL